MTPEEIALLRKRARPMDDSVTASDLLGRRAAGITMAGAGRQMRLGGLVVITESDIDPGELGEPRIFSEDGVTFVTVPSWDDPMTGRARQMWDVISAARDVLLVVTDDAASVRDLDVLRGALGRLDAEDAT